MDDHEELTPWEEINPATALARQPGRPSALSATATSRLAPATKADFRRELTACLALTAPVGMTQDDRQAWLTVAYGTLSHLPPDLLAEGCRHARQEADHPSKIVPIIVRTTEEALALRRKNAASDMPNFRLPPPPDEVPDRCTPEQAAAILEQYGLRSVFRA